MTALVLVLQYRVHKSESHAVVAFFRTCDIALDDCERAAGRPLGVRLETCRARGCALLMFIVVSRNRRPDGEGMKFMICW